LAYSAASAAGRPARDRGEAAHRRCERRLGQPPASRRVVLAAGDIHIVGGARAAPAPDALLLRRGAGLRRLAAWRFRREEAHLLDRGPPQVAVALGFPFAEPRLLTEAFLKPRNVGSGIRT
jgi:hypothetical protein